MLSWTRSGRGMIFRESDRYFSKQYEKSTNVVKRFNQMLYATAYEGNSSDTHWKTTSLLAPLNIRRIIILRCRESSRISTQRHTLMSLKSQLNQKSNTYHPWSHPSEATLLSARTRDPQLGRCPAPSTIWVDHRKS